MRERIQAFEKLKLKYPTGNINGKVIVADKYETVAAGYVFKCLKNDRCLYSECCTDWLDDSEDEEGSGEDW